MLRNTRQSYSVKRRVKGQGDWLHNKPRQQTRHCQRDWLPTSAAGLTSLVQRAPTFVLGQKRRLLKSEAVLLAITTSSKWKPIASTWYSNDTTGDLINIEPRLNNRTRSNVGSLRPRPVRFVAVNKSFKLCNCHKRKSWAVIKNNLSRHDSPN